MKEICVGDIVRVCGGRIVCGSVDEVCGDFCKDTRVIKSGDVYVGIKGENFDGSLMYEKALENGASVCVLENVDVDEGVVKRYPDCSIVVVEDSVVALQKLAEFKRSMYDIPVVAVTGSVGKTSTKDILAEVVGRKYKVLKTEGNLNNHIGLPLTILKLKDHTALVVEMGMSARGEISVLTNIAKPNICVITNVGTSHIGKLGSRENILKAKLEILEGMQENGTLVINNDNDLLHEWNNQNTTYNVSTFGIKNESNIMAQKIDLQEYSSIFTTIINNEQIEVNVPVGGEPFILNALCAISVGKLLNIPNNDITKAIQEFKLTKNRMDIYKNKKGTTIINDCYNANYDSMKAGIQVLAAIKTQRKIAVLGDMLELGEYSKELHEKVAEEVLKNKIDILITIGNEANHIHQKAITLGLPPKNAHHLTTLDQAIQLLNQILTNNDALLIKASNGMHFIKIVEALK